MTFPSPKSIRAKVTIMAAVANALAMALIVVAMGFGARTIFEQAITDSLQEHVNQACELVKEGKYEEAADVAGNVVIQIIDKDGKVVAGSRNVRGLAAITTLDAPARSEVNGLQFNLKKPDKNEQDDIDGSSAEHDQDAAATLITQEEDSATATQTRDVDDDGDVDDRDDDRDDDADDRDDDDSRDDDADDRDDDDDRIDNADDDDDADEGSVTPIQPDDADDNDDDGRDDDGDDDDDADEGSVTPIQPDDDDDDDYDYDGGGGDADDADDDDYDYDDGGGDADDADDDDYDYDDGGTDDADDDDDDDDDRESSRRVMTQAKQPGGNAFSKSNQQANSASLLWNSVAWADEPNSDEGTIDAKSIFGVEGPYVILKEQVESPDGQMTVVGASSLASAIQSAKQLAWLLGIIMIAVLIAVIAFAWMLTGRTLRPVEEMRAQAEAITENDLGQRIDVPESDKDLARLAVTLNEMLSRVERSLEEEKRFVSDASHELKSPIAASTIIIDTLRAYPDSLDLPTALDDLAHENAHMTSIVNDMLVLTRYDEDRLICHPEPIDLMDFILERTIELSAWANCAIDTTGVQPIVCFADEKLLSHAVRNLLDNAARYATSVVKVSCEEGDGMVVITVSDDGCGIAPEDRVRVFGRYTCLNDGRSGTGLGLAVAKTAIVAQGGTIAFVDPELSGATARIELPAH